jgi:hypothetical protein
MLPGRLRRSFGVSRGDRIHDARVLAHEHRGLVRDADEKPLRAIAEELRGLRERAAYGRLKVGDVRGGTFTLSNYGMLRSVVWATPIVTPGQVGVLGVARAVPGWFSTGRPTAGRCTPSCLWS